MEASRRTTSVEVKMLAGTSRVLSLLLACVVLSQASLAAGDGGGAEAEARVREANDRLRQLLRDSPDAAEVGQLVDSLLDYEGLAQRALVNHWGRLTQAQRDEFLSLFKALVAKSYRDNLKETLDNIAVDFLGWEQTTAGSVVVKTRVRKLQTRRSRRAEMSIHYEMRLVGGTWKMIDVTTNGVSLVQSYRDQFNNIIGQAQTFEAGWADLIGRMRRKLHSEP